MMIPADRLSNTEYHAKKDHISSSDVKMVHSKSLAHWKAKTYSPSPVFDMAAVRLGQKHMRRRRQTTKRC